MTFNSSKQQSPEIQRTTEAVPMRTIVQDGTIYTLTSTGIAAHSVDSLDRLTFSKF